MKNKYLVVLGARIGIDRRGIMVMSEHMLMRANSALQWWQENPGTKIIICGGPSFHVRYPLHLHQPRLDPPDFSPEAGQKAARLPSESSVIAAWLNCCGVPYEEMILEQKSRTTAENAKEAAKIIKELGNGPACVISMIYHLLRPHEDAVRANPGKLFRSEFASANLGYSNPMPVFTEEVLLRKHGAHYLSDIRKFYKKPRSGYLWDAEEICRRLKARENLMDLQPISKATARTETRYVVRKHVLNLAEEEIRHEDYPEEFDDFAEAEVFMKKKEQKYLETVEDYHDEGSEPIEKRRYSIVPIEVSM